MGERSRAIRRRTDSEASEASGKRHGIHGSPRMLSAEEPMSVAGDLAGTRLLSLHQ